MISATRRFYLRPLTPIHIGTGDRLLPQQRMDLEKAMDSGRLRDAQNILQRTWITAARSNRSEMERFRVKLGFTSFNHLKDISSYPERLGEVSSLPRNPFTSQVTLPGSSIKGSLRTALLSLRASPPPAYSASPELTNISDSAVLEQEILRYRPSTLENDPFRLLDVSDAAWQPSGVQIDMPDFRKLGRGETKIQSHVERLLSRADGSPLRAEVDITIEAATSRRSSIQKPLSWEELFAACHKFYIDRLNKEFGHFPFLQDAAPLWMQTLQQDLNAGALLVRLGRFCHFDSMSLDNLRKKPARTGAVLQDIGATRTVCQVQPNSSVPFGWALLEPK